MFIQIGYDIEIGVTAPTALIYLLQVHPSRAGDVVGSENITISPPLATDFYRDSFDNQCARATPLYFFVYVPYLFVRLYR